MCWCVNSCVSVCPCVCDMWGPGKIWVPGKNVIGPGPKVAGVLHVLTQCLGTAHAHHLTPGPLHLPSCSAKSIFWCLSSRPPVLLTADSGLSLKGKSDTTPPHTPHLKSFPFSPVPSEDTAHSSAWFPRSAAWVPAKGPTPSISPRPSGPITRSSHTDCLDCSCIALSLTCTVPS